MPRARLAFCLALLMAAGAAAQPIDQPAAQRLQHELQAWFGDLLGSGLGASTEPLRVTPEDDQFRVALPFAAATGAAEVSATVHPLGDERWSVDALRLPATARFRLQAPEPGGSPGTNVPTMLALRIGNQNNRALIDPALATPSRLDLDLSDLALATDSAHAHQEHQIGHYSLQAMLTPHRGDLDLTGHGTVVAWRSASRVDDGAITGFGADRIQASGEVTGIDAVRARAMLSAVTGLIATMPAAPTQPHGAALSAPARNALRALIESLSSIATRVQGQETIDGLHVAVAGVGEATVRQARLGIDGAAPGGILHATLTLALDGLAVKDLPPPERALMPRHLAARPSIVGVSMADLRRLALTATDPHASSAVLAADTAALLARGGVTIGMETLDANVGPAELHGCGHVVLTAPGQYTARAHITAAGFDALMQQAATNPDLRRALPLLAMARGFARQEGDHLAWDIVADNSGLTVNDVPLGNPQAYQPQPHKR